MADYDDSKDPAWERLTKAFFRVEKTTDEGLFVFKVMEEIRTLSKPPFDMAWLRFRRWAFPLLGAGIACLAIALRIPAAANALSLDRALFQQTVDEDPLSPLLEE